MSGRYFHGWNVVGATFVMALWSFGLGFYGLGVYVAALQALHGWSASAVSTPVTAYYIAGALLTGVIGDLYERFGPRLVVMAGSVAMAAGLAALGHVATPWQLYPAFLLMSAGWGAMSGAAINIILAPWFERRRVVTSATLGIQIVGVALLARAPSAVTVYSGCALFGLGVGNLTTLPGLVLAAEWPRERFSSLVGLVVAINQFTFALGPSLVGVVRDLTGGYRVALGVCAALQALAAALILLGPGGDVSTRDQRARRAAPGA